jgi:predicted DNA-binding transcriptional regulator YafY
MPETLLRQWLMLRSIPRAPRRISTAMLEEKLADQGFEIDRRSIQRDMHKLSSFFPLVCDDSTKPYGWSWSRDAVPFDLPGMGLHTALAFQLASEYLEHLLPHSTRRYLDPHFRHARSVLDGLQGGELASWPRKVRVIPPGQRLHPPEVDEVILECVQTALLEERRLGIIYHRRGERKRKEYEVNPLGLVYRDVVAYLVCTFWEYDDLMQIVLHRIERAELLDRPRRVPLGFDLDEYISSGALGFLCGNASIHIELLFSNYAASSLAETPLSEDQVLETQADGRVLLQATVADTRQLRTWLHGFGPHVEVLAPAELRHDFVGAARKMARLYGG